MKIKSTKYLLIVICENFFILNTSTSKQHATWENLLASCLFAAHYLNKRAGKIVLKNPEARTARLRAHNSAVRSSLLPPCFLLVSLQAGLTYLKLPLIFP